MKQIGTPNQPRIWYIFLNIFLYSFPLVILVVFFIVMPTFKESLENEHPGRGTFAMVIALFGMLYTFILLPIIFFYQMYLLAKKNKNVTGTLGYISRFIFGKLGIVLDQAQEVYTETHKSAVHEIKHERDMKDVLYYTEMAKANYYEAVGDLEKAKARLLLEGAKYLNDMTPRWRAYVIACIMGSQGTKDEDADLQDEINRIKLEIELEALRTKKMENDERQRRQEANNRPPPDV